MNVTYDRLAKLVTDKTTEVEFVKLFNTIGADRQIELQDILLKDRQAEWIGAKERGVPLEAYVVGCLARLETAFELNREFDDTRNRFAEEFARREESSEVK